MVRRPWSPISSTSRARCSAKPQDPKAKGEKRNSTGYDGVRMVELTEKVRFCQWSDGGSALGPSGATGPGSSAPPPAEPPTAPAPEKR